MTISQMTVGYMTVGQITVSLKTVGWMAKRQFVTMTDDQKTFGQKTVGKEKTVGHNYCWQYKTKANSWVPLFDLDRRQWIRRHSAKWQSAKWQSAKWQSTKWCGTTATAPSSSPRRLKTASHSKNWLEMHLWPQPLIFESVVDSSLSRIKIRDASTRNERWSELECDLMHNHFSSELRLDSWFYWNYKKSLDHLIL